MGTKSDARKRKKQKKRQERIRQEKHQRRAQGRPEELSDDFSEERFLRTVAWLARTRLAGDAAAVAAYAAMDPSDNRWVADWEAMLDAEPHEQAQEQAFLAMEYAHDPDYADELLDEALELDPENLDARRLTTLGEQQGIRRGAALLGLHEDFTPGMDATLAALPADAPPWARVHLLPAARLAWDGVITAMRMRSAGPGAGWARRLWRSDPPAHADIAAQHLHWTLELDDLPTAAALLADPAYAGRTDDAWRWGAVLERILAGDLVEAQARIQRLRAAGATDIQQLMKGTDLRPPAGQEPRTEIGLAWACHPEAMRWVIDGVPPGAPPAG